jgi:release factor glutamine methyltransferase
MKLKDTRELFRKELKGLYDKEEIDNFFYMLLQSYLGVKRLDLAIKPELSFTKEEQSSILEALDSLKKHIPIQYILGETEFFGLAFKVGPSVLIPRPETEELVDWIINCHGNSNKQLRVLDIGTGSACIAVSLAKKLLQAKVYALDISEDALRIAKQNAELNHVEIEFIQADILNPKTWDLALKKLEFDIIVSNPPYVRKQEKSQMKDNVLMYEPHLALFVEDDDPLVFYKAIVQYAVDKLSQNGNLYFEINEYLGTPMTQLLHEYHFSDIELKQDVFKKDRMIKGTKTR